ncbi:MAG: HEAT repeat domain-containing protein [Planctomycetota bacterium JB042]
MIPRLLLSLLLLSAPAYGASKIEWRSTAEAAFEEAKRDGKVVFVAINMDGERANDEMVAKHYQDSTIAKLAKLTVPLFASKEEHDSGDRPCPRGDVVTCAEHQKVEKEVRKRYLQTQNDSTIAPQHLWIGPDGTLLLSVPYQISTGEMEWCFVTAIKQVDPQFKWTPSGSARAPRRLVTGDVIATALDTARPPPTKKEVQALIEEMRKERRPWDRRGDILRILLSDEKEAIDYAKTIVTSRGRGGRFGGGGDDRAMRWKAELIHAIGQYSPPDYWEILPTLLIDSQVTIRSEAAVALEQLAAPKALSELNKAYKKEEEFAVRKELIRAIASCGRSGKATRTVTMTALKGKEEELRPYAMVGVAYLEDRKAVLETVRDGLLHESPAVRATAAWVIGIRRETELQSVLETALESETDFDVKGALEAVKGVLAGGEAGPLDAVLRQFAGSEIARDRV